MAVLNQIQVTGLLGRFRHKVDFPEQDSFVILHGPNGVGKTHLLKLVYAVLSGEFWRLDSIKFDEVTLGFSDNHSIIIQKYSDDEDALLSLDEATSSKKPRTQSMRLVLKKGSRTVDTWSPDNGEGGGFTSRIYHLLDRDTPLDRFDKDEWYDPRSGSFYSTEEAVSKFLGGTRHSVGKGVGQRLYKLPPKIDEIFEDLAVKFVQTQRLTVADIDERPRTARRMAPGPGAGPRQSTVVEFSQHLVGLIDKNLAENSKISSELDRTFPKRVLERNDDPSVTSDDLLATYRDQTILRNRLAEVALLDSADDISLEDREFDSVERRVLLTYLEDAEQKLGTFKEILEKITLLRQIINDRFLFKTLRIDPKDGFVFEGDRGDIVVPGQLSSGEQHELVLLYELLFRTTPGSVVLIDEPEISLHVKWQREFLRDMLAVANLSRVRFIIATHSPQIVDKWYAQAVFLAPGEDWQ